MSMNAWLKSKRFFECTQPSLQGKFTEEVEEWRNNLRNLFTATADQVHPSCHIGMTAQEFDRIKIPVIPTSQLDRGELDKMKHVGYGHWFDRLLIKCCQKLQGSGLRLHNERLSKLPHDLAKQEFDEEEYRSLLRKLMIKPCL